MPRRFTSVQSAAFKNFKILQAKLCLWFWDAFEGSRMPPLKTSQRCLGHGTAVQSEPLHLCGVRRCANGCWAWCWMVLDMLFGVLSCCVFWRTLFPSQSAESRSELGDASSVSQCLLVDQNSTSFQ